MKNLLKDDDNLEMSEAYQKSKKRVDLARNVLLVAIIFTIINVVSVFFDFDSYYIFSFFISYLLFFARGILTVCAIGFLGLLVLAYFLSKTKRIWLFIGLGMIIVDTICIVLLSAIYAEANSSVTVNMVTEIIAHIVASIIMIIGMVKSGEYYKRFNQM